MKEYFDIRDSAGNPTGEVKARSLVHRDGDIHGTSHVWLVRKNKKSGYDVLLQKRSDNKDSFPDVTISLPPDICRQEPITGNRQSGN